MGCSGPLSVGGTFRLDPVPGIRSGSETYSHTGSPDGCWFCEREEGTRVASSTRLVGWEDRRTPQLQVCGECRLGSHSPLFLNARANGWQLCFYARYNRPLCSSRFSEA